MPPGRLLFHGGHRLRRLLGRDSGWESWSCADPTDPAHEARLLRAVWELPPAAAERFLAHAAARRAMAHPALTPVLDAGADPFPFVVVGGELRPGSLAAAAPPAPAGPERGRRAAALVAPLAEALAVLHASGLVHGEFTAARVEFDPGAASARLLPALPGVPPLLASPEQARGQAPTAASDLWGLGAMLFELCAGRAPEEGLPEDARPYARGFWEPPPLAARCPGVPPALADLTDRLLRHARGARPRSAASVAERLYEITRSGVSRPWPDPPSPERPPHLPAPLLGRASELRCLLEGAAPVIAVAGPAGSGKTRLLEETLLRIVASGESAALVSAPSGTGVPAPATAGTLLLDDADLAGPDLLRSAVLHARAGACRLIASARSAASLAALVPEAHIVALPPLARRTAEALVSAWTGGGSKRPGGSSSWVRAPVQPGALREHLLAHESRDGTVQWAGSAASMERRLARLELPERECLAALAETGGGQSEYGLSRILGRGVGRDLERLFAQGWLRPDDSDAGAAYRLAQRMDGDLAGMLLGPGRREALALRVRALYPEACGSGEAPPRRLAFVFAPASPEDDEPAERLAEIAARAPARRGAAPRARPRGTAGRP